MRFLALVLALVLGFSLTAGAANINDLKVSPADFLRTPPIYVDKLVLGTPGTAETSTVPTDSKTGGKANRVLFHPYACDIEVKTNGTAAIASGDVTDGTASVPNPTGYWLGGSVTSISVISSTACTVALEYRM